VAYDDQNIFAKILRGEIPCDKVLETDHSLAFNDISPARPVHVLVIPKGPYVSADDFTAKASDAEIADFWRAVGEVARMRGVEKSGYRLIANAGEDGHQEVPHFHMHVLGGAPAGPMLKRRDS
jgi:histidine triad (HIT) family protein